MFNTRGYLRTCLLLLLVGLLALPWQPAGDVSEYIRTSVP
jgi:hypothetical protein